MSFADRISAKNRHRKWKLFTSIFLYTPATSVLDVGFLGKEDSAVTNYLEKYYPYPVQITALGIDEPTEFVLRYPGVKAVRYDGATFPFANQSFDIVWSNAVLEHVGSREDQVSFLREVMRVGKRAFLTTPNYWFPVEVHTRTPVLHWLPKKWFDCYLRWIGKEWATGDYMHLLTLGGLQSLLKDAGITNYTIIKNHVFGFVVDFVVIL